MYLSMHHLSIVASARLPAAKPPPRRVPKAATDAAHTWHGAGSGAENSGFTQHSLPFHGGNDDKPWGYRLVYFTQIFRWTQMFLGPLSGNFLHSLLWDSYLIWSYLGSERYFWIRTLQKKKDQQMRIDEILRDSYTIYSSLILICLVRPWSRTNSLRQKIRSRVISECPKKILHRGQKARFTCCRIFL